MGLSILSNIPSLEAQNQLAITNQNLQNVLFQLSSGSKINSGADDPAGLSIADGLQANISALTQSAQNVTDGVGMLQTADGALSQVTTLLNRAVTLATEAGNAGLTTDQQNALQTEYTSITQEINQIGSNTTYNNNQVFTNQLTSVFLSDGSQVDSADPTISVTIPSLSATSLGLASYATGTLDLTGQPTAGNTVQIGQQTYTFTSAGQANAAGDVALGSNVQGTLQNLQNAVNGTGTASAGTYGVGTAANTEAQIVSVNGGSAVVQALQAGAPGNAVTLTTNLSSNVGAGGGTTLSGGVNATDQAGTLTLAAQPGLLATAMGSLTMTAQPDTIANATGLLNLGTTALPAAGNATGTITFAGAPANGSTVTIGGTAYTFETGALAAANQVAVNGSLANAMTNLMNAVNGTGTASGTTFFAGTTAAGNAVVSAINTTTGVATIAATSLVPATGNAVTLAASVATVSGATLAGGTTSDTATVGGQAYTFVAANAAVANNEVALGSGGTTAQNIQTTLTNLMNAVNRGGVGGTAATYSAGATAAGTATMALNGTAGEAAVTAATAGTAGNSIALTSSITGAVDPTGHLSGGAAADTVNIGGTAYTFVAAGQAVSADQVALGSASPGVTDIQATLNNLMHAVNGTGTASNTTYGAGTVQNANATITAILNGVATVEAGTGGVAAPGAGGNGIGLAATSPVGAITASGNLTGGAAADTVTVGNVTYTFVGAGQATAGNNEVALGATYQNTLDNLMAAVNSTAITNGSAATYQLASAAMLQSAQGAAGATITSDANGVATVRALTAGPLSPGLDVSAVFQGGNATGTVGGFVSNLAGGSATTAATGLVDLTGGQPAVGNATGTVGLGLTQPTAAVNATGALTLGATQPTVGNSHATLTLSTAVPANGDTVTIGTQTYTFVTSGNATTAGDVAISSTGNFATDANTTLNNLMDAVNNIGTGSATTFDNGGVANTTAVISNVTGAVATAEDTTPGVGNNLVVAKTFATGANGTWSAVTNGSASDTVTIGNQTYTFVAAGAAAGANQVALGGSVQATLTNLQDAVNGVGSGTLATYGAATVANTVAQITAINNGTGAATVTATTAGVGNGVVGATGNGNTTPLSATGAIAADTTAFSGGVNGDTVTIGANIYSFVASGDAFLANSVALGGSVQATLQNLQNAVNGTGTAGLTAYGVPTVANAQARVSAINNTTGVATIAATSLVPATGDAVALAASAATVSGATLTGGTTSDNVTIGGTTYTFVAANTATANNEVALGANNQATLDNLMAAVNSTLANYATTETAATFHLTNATMIQGATGAGITSVNGGQAVVTANTVGAAGNAIALSGSLTNGVAGTPGGGAAATESAGNLVLNANPTAGNTVTIGTQTYTFTATQPTAANQVMLGSTITDTLNHLKEAVNGVPAGAGTDYGNGTVANPEAQISSVSGNQAVVTATTTYSGTAGNAVILNANLSSGAGGGTVGTVNSQLSGGGTSVSLDSASDAQAALTVIAGAISTVASTRGAIGSSINQMNAAVQVMNNTSQNLSSSLSGIQDANIGKVVANMSKYQVLEQTGIASLTQANQNEQIVLKLLQ